MTFAEISKVNLERALLWHPGGLEEWSVSDWSNAMAGEAGEVCNAVKKLRRWECQIQDSRSIPPEELKLKIAREIGDTYLYLNLLSLRLGIDIEQAIIDTFNRVSIQEGFPQRL